MKRNVIAIVGRPNVGKSTLFNRIIGKSHSIVSEVEGVTRDRVRDSFDWGGIEYDIIDNVGIPREEFTEDFFTLIGDILIDIIDEQIKEDNFEYNPND